MEGLRKCNLKKGHDRHGASLQTHPNEQLPFKTHPISSLRVHRATIGRNLVFLRGFSENSFASLINRARALAAHNADNPAGGSPVMVNDDNPSSHNRRG